MALIVALGTLAAPAAPALAVTPSFDPLLSLTGGCGTSNLDPVPDPGCPAGTHPAAGPFDQPASVTTDEHGDVFVVSAGEFGGAEDDGRVDVFDPTGHFLSELPTGSLSGAIAVDSEGNLYVNRPTTQDQLVVYEPTEYEPENGKIAYGSSPATLVGFTFTNVIPLQINPQNDHLFAYLGSDLYEFSSAADGNTLENSSVGGGAAQASQPTALAIDATRGRIYVGTASGPADSVQEVTVLELAAPHNVIETFDGATTPTGSFDPRFSLAVDESSGNLYVYNTTNHRTVYELSGTGDYIATIEHGFKAFGGEQLAVDNGAESPNGALNPGGRYLYVPSHPTGEGHSFAFGPSPPEEPPVVESASFGDVSEVDAELRASINPGHLATHYRFEYLTQQQYEEAGDSFAGAQVAGEGDIPAGGQSVAVTAHATGLAPGVTYRFRVVATNTQGTNTPGENDEGSFSTYPANPTSSCPNDAVRVGSSALLPDCRAYELVTPAVTNGRSPVGVRHLGTYFPTREASPAGDAVSFSVEGGGLPGFDVTGSLAGDPYRAVRGADGWLTQQVATGGATTTAAVAGSSSPDQGYATWSAQGEGSLVVGNQATSYVSYPDGHSSLLGVGSAGEDPRAVGVLISENGGHIIFRTGGTGAAVQLEPAAPPSGTAAIYDRTSDGVTHVVSLLPNDVQLSAGQNAFFQGVSLDGRGVAFRVGSASTAAPLYLRFDNEETFEATPEGAFAGVAEGGARLFYLRGGNLYRFDAETGQTKQFTASGNVTPVNVSPDGTTVYFVSPSVLTSEANPNGSKPKAGKQNLYLSNEGTIKFVGTVTDRDVEGVFVNVSVEGLGLWLDAVGTGRLAEEPSRITPDGDVLVFESRADLTPYQTEGSAQIYRFDVDRGELECVSCNPTGAPPSGRASLQSISQGNADPEPFSAVAIVNNLRADGRRLFFQSEDALVANDTDRSQDVYQWEDKGVGSCDRPGGCVSLISSGHSAKVDYLYAVSASGDDVFIRSGDQLVPQDAEQTPSLYDARVGGGFAATETFDCEEAGTCRPTTGPPPVFHDPLTPVLGNDNKTQQVKRCPKGKRKVRRHGKVVCVRKQQHHRRAGSKRKEAAK